MVGRSTITLCLDFHWTFLGMYHTWAFLLFTTCIIIGFAHCHTLLSRSTPVETLHTILLGACKYMLRSFMDKRSPAEKKEILARILSFSYSGFTCRITGNISCHYRSFVGRDFKAWMQMVLFIVPSYLSANQTKCWYLLSKVTLLIVKVPCYLVSINRCSS